MPIQLGWAETRLGDESIDDPWTCRIGGPRSAWPTTPMCPHCNTPRVLILQLHSPLSVIGLDERAITVFLCVKCSIYSAQRMQRKAIASTKAVSFGDGDGWGGGDDWFDADSDQGETEPQTKEKKEDETAARHIVPLWVTFDDDPVAVDDCGVDERHVKEAVELYKGAAASSEWADEEYEATGDKAWEKFTSAARRAPGHCLRYGFGEPALWPNASKPEPPPCSHCKARRWCEVVLMPPLLTRLVWSDTGTVNEELDFGAIAVYTCSMSCSAGEEIVDEWVAVHDGV